MKALGKKLTTSLSIQSDAPHHLILKRRRYRCVLGWGGLSENKREGDGATPTGCFPLRRVLYRADRVAKPKTRLPVRPLAPNDGWCDDVTNKAYNKPVSRPFSAGHECLWRHDHIYDVIVELGYNDAPVIAGKGSAIFMHVARSVYSYTEGCIALQQKDLLNVLKNCGPETDLFIPAPYKSKNAVQK